MSEEEIELIDYLRVIWKRRWLIVGGTLACMVAALAVSFLLPKVYQGSMILETGRIYSLTKGDQQEKLELIEDPKSIETLLKSDGVLYQMKERIGSDTDVQTLRQAIQIDVKSNPLIIINLRLPDRQAIINGLNFLAERIISDHKKKYENITRKLDHDLSATLEKMKKPADKIRESKHKREQIREKIKNIKTQILIEREQINTDNTYRKVVEDQMKNAIAAMAESKLRLSELDVKKASPLEILFLQTTLQNHELRLADFQREINDLRQREDDRQKQIAEREKQMADLEIQIRDLDAQNADFEGQIEDFKQIQYTLDNFKAVSENTRLRAAPVVLEKPVLPRKKLNMAIAGIIGLMSTLMLAFFVEYLETANAKQRKGTNDKSP